MRRLGRVRVGLHKNTSAMFTSTCVIRSAHAGLFVYVYIYGVGAPLIYLSFWQNTVCPSLSDIRYYLLNSIGYYHNSLSSLIAHYLILYSSGPLHALLGLLSLTERADWHSTVLV